MVSVLSLCAPFFSSSVSFCSFLCWPWVLQIIVVALNGMETEPDRRPVIEYFVALCDWYRHIRAAPHTLTSLERLRNALARYVPSQ